MSERILLTRIVASRWQPRDAAFDAERLWDLARSIKETGLINPVVVFPVQVAEDDPGTWYELVAGERRVRAVTGLAWAKVDEGVSEKEAVEALAMAGLTGLPDEARGLLAAAGAEIAATVEAAEDLERLHRVAVVENLERESLAPLEEARALEGLAEEYGWSQRELARRIGRSQSYVAQRFALLGLSDEARAAVSTRALTATHARAIGRVPVELQPAVTEWAVTAVGSDDSPATTRQVQNRARQLAAFVDPERWLPNEKKVYRPRERNRLALMRWAVGQADLGECAEGLLALASTGYDRSNWLAKAPVALVTSSPELSKASKALGQGGRQAAWERFAEETGRACETCVLGAVELPPDDDQVRGHCGREGVRVATCEGWIGADDPVVIPLGYFRLREWFKELKVEFEEEPFAHVTSVEDYVAGCAAVVVAAGKREAERASQASRVHIEGIQQFMEWQLGQPDGVLAHFQAHACAKCAHYRPELVERELPPCSFIEDPLVQLWSKSQARAPEFGVLVSRAGEMLPRCEQFVYRELPALARAGGFWFGIGSDAHKRAVEWLRGLIVGRTVYGSKEHTLFGVLRWLDYGRGRKKAQDLDKLPRWVRQNWDELGGDEAVAVLLDVAMAETQARASTKHGVMGLVNATTGEVEEFVPLGFEYVTGEREVQRRWFEWPEGWPRPWESTTDGEMDDG